MARKIYSSYTELRTAAANEFEKDFFKLMNNSVFGKTMENIRNRADIKLVNNKKQAKKLAANPSFNHYNIFSEDLVAIHMKKTRLVFNKPVYLGLCILDLSKTLMYDFHYNYNKQKYGDKAKLLFTDTDSLMYEIQTEDFYKDISADVIVGLILAIILLITHQVYLLDLIRRCPVCLKTRLVVKL